jgi:hypothetical protein
MPSLLMKKKDYGLAVVDLHGVEALSIYNKETILHVEVRANKGNKMHKKLHDLLSLAYEAWNPKPLEHEGKTVGKSFERFRKDITVMLGNYYASVGINGELILDAKQINFNSMSDYDFGLLYDATGKLLKKLVDNGTIK